MNWKASGLEVQQAQPGAIIYIDPRKAAEFRRYKMTRNIALQRKLKALKRDGEILL